ncbi:hypothetical protein [Streptomyces sp. NBC_01022]|uniref:hypothetical protein n=1 Tax=Streptomyces sp. NBC_01022 TaxID=2903723 RepID=UPI002DDC8D70|nr:hypothetical protein [Streptomyces sp. NBC_01022]WRZ82686.1 hypothetical protein OG316_21685 [Streptomyces sp. NBC_01022]
MAIDPERIRQRMLEAEESGRRGLRAEEARAILRELAVVRDGTSKGERRSEIAALTRAS